MKIKVLGLGHSMRGDDEVGLLIVQRWNQEHQSRYPDDQVESGILESPGITLLGEIAGRDAAVLVDAVQSGAPAGTVHRITENDLEVFGEGTGSAHGWGAAETLSLGHRLVPEDMPECILLIGVEAVQFELGEGLSPAVRSAVPKAVDLINQVLDELLGRKTLLYQLLSWIGIRK